MSVIIGANSAVAGGFPVDNSVRLNDGSSDSFNLTWGTPTNNLIWSFSTWVKRSDVTTTQNIFSARIDGSNFGMISINSSGFLDVASYIGGFEMRYITNRVFRDVGAWYHIFVSNDSSLASPETKIYINGVLETSFSTSNPASQDEESMINKSGVAHWVGQNGSSGSYFDGYLAETVFLDGTANAVTDFGEFDEDSGIWKPISVSGLTYGTNGFYLDFEDSAALGADVSGNTNNFTVNNLTAIDQTTDTPTNNFCTMNPLDNYYANAAFSEGNLVYSSARYASPTSTFAITQGKWYWEIKVNSMVASSFIGITSATADATNFEFGNKSGAIAGWVYAMNGAIYGNGGTPHGTGVFATYGAGDTLMMATDLDSNKIYFGKSGTWGNSQNPVDGTNSIAISALSTQTSGYYRFGAMGETGNATVFSWNFGNPAHTISSGNADGNGYGNFEYAVPSGYLALNTANLSEVLS